MRSRITEKGLAKFLYSLVAASLPLALSRHAQGSSVGRSEFVIVCD
jgi:hypothetical protein